MKRTFLFIAAVLYASLCLAQNPGGAYDPTANYSTSGNNVHTGSETFAGLTNNGGVSFTQVQPPTGAGLTNLRAGGNLLAQTYYWKVTATNQIGETQGSAEVSFKVATANSTLTVIWNASIGATGYKVYRGTSSNAESLCTSVTQTTFVDNGAACSGASVPSSNTTAGILAPEQATPNSPAPANEQKGYFKAGSGFCTLDSGNSEHCPGGSSAGVSTFNSRNGAVTPQTGDYNFNQLSGSASAAQLPNPTLSTIGGIRAIDCSSGGQLVQKLNTDGTVTCATPAGGNPAGSGTEIQFKNGSSFGAVAGSSVSGANITVNGQVNALNFSGPLTGAVTGNASTATALASAPSNCGAGNAPTGVDTQGNAQNCQALSSATGIAGATLGQPMAYVVK